MSPPSSQGQLGPEGSSAAAGRSLFGLFTWRWQHASSRGARRPPTWAYSGRSSRGPFRQFRSRDPGRARGCIHAWLRPGPPRSSVLQLAASQQGHFGPALPLCRAAAAALAAPCVSGQLAPLWRCQCSSVVQGVAVFGSLQLAASAVAAAAVPCCGSVSVTQSAATLVRPCAAWWCE